jgi:cytochrome c biogenesis protein CcmG/thiol:disulfide interchange protein DsbE
MTTRAGASTQRTMRFYSRRHLLILGAVALASARCSAKASDDGSSSREPTFPKPGSAAPEFALPVLASGPPAGENRDLPLERVATLQANRGRIVMLEFWATWCDPCLRLHPEIARMAQRYRNRGLVTYGIVYQDAPSRALAWLRARGGPQYAELRDDDGAAARAYGVRAIPQMFLIGPDGRVLSHCWGCATVAEDFGVVLDSIVNTPATHSLSSGSIGDSNSRGPHLGTRTRIQ